MLSPIGGGSDTKKLRTLLPKALAERWRKELGIEVGNHFEALPLIEHWRCKTTGLEWYTPSEAAGVGALYSQLQNFSWYYMHEKWEFDTAIASFPKTARILEVGIGPGHFLRLAQRNGLEVKGVELNAAAAARAREAGFEVYEEDIEVLAGRLGAAFDGLCAFQVLEHVPDPISFLRETLAMLRPCGTLVLSVPNARVMRAIDPKGSGLLDQPPHHMTKWDAGVFESLERYLPMQLIALKREPLQAYHIDWFVQSIGGRFRHALGRAGPLLVNRITLRCAQWLLRIGLRQVIPGHTLLAIFKKTP